MSLATRCTACGTVFRVVQDQLKVSEGWVRCGRCDEVFNALEGIFDLVRDTPASEDALEIAPPVLAPAPEAAASGTVDRRDAARHDTSAANKIDAQLGESRYGLLQSTPAARVNERDRLEFPDAEFASDFGEPFMDSRQPADVPYGELPARPTVEDLPPMSPELLPSSPDFVRHAHQRARWESRPVRLGMSAAAFVLMALLLLQIGHQFRDLLAARSPALKPVLTAWCGLMGCSIQLPRRIDDLSVDSTALTRAAAPDSFRLAVALRNHGTVAVAVPAVDLSLTDATGQLIARRVLTPGDFQAAPAAVAPGSDSALQLLLTAGSTKVSGYTVEIFYP